MRHYKQLPKSAIIKNNVDIQNHLREVYHITDLDTLFHLKYNRGYSTRFAKNQLGITTDETDNWRHLEVAGKTFIELSRKML